MSEKKINDALSCIFALHELLSNEAEQERKKISNEETNKILESRFEARRFFIQTFGPNSENPSRDGPETPSEVIKPSIFHFATS
jgi:hypothetical protein